MQGATKVLSDSPGACRAFLIVACPTGKHRWFLFSDDKMSFDTKECVAESP